MHVPRVVPATRDCASPTPPSGNVSRQSTVPAPASAATSSVTSTAPAGVSSRATPSPAEANASAHRGKFLGSRTNSNTCSRGAMISIPCTSNIFIVILPAVNPPFGSYDDNAARSVNPPLRAAKLRRKARDLHLESFHFADDGVFLELQPKRSEEHTSELQSL